MLIKGAPDDARGQASVDIVSTQFSQTEYTGLNKRSFKKIM